MPSLPSTLWTEILHAGQGAPDALSSLVSRYLEPVYAYVRASGYPRQDAEDLTHEFFVHMLEKPVLSRADPERGRFRAFLTTCLRNFLRDQLAKQRAAIRGGDRRHLPFDVEHVERLITTQGAAADPQKLLDRRWAQTTLDRALELLHSELTPGASQVFSLAYGSDGFSRPEIAEQTGISQEAIATSVYRARKKLREILLTLVRDTVQDEDDGRSELEELLAALG